MCRVEKYNNSQLVYYYYRIIIVNSQLVYFCIFFSLLDSVKQTCNLWRQYHINMHTGHVLTDRGDACGVRQWYSGQKHFLFNGVSKDATKYENRKNVSSTMFSLVIKNYTESDLNINYTCSCGFKSYAKRLGLSDNNFISKYID